MLLGSELPVTRGDQTQAGQPGAKADFSWPLGFWLGDGRLWNRNNFSMAIPEIMPESPGKLFKTRIPGCPCRGSDSSGLERTWGTFWKSL